MTTADYALIVSIVSLTLSTTLSLAALLWNVWQKYIFVKPTLYVGFGVWRVMHPGSPDDRKQLLCLTVTNMGPGPSTLMACTAKMTRLPRWWPRHPGFGILNPIHNDPLAPVPTSIGPFSAGLPMKVDAAETKAFYFPYTADCFLKQSPIVVGINDSYHRLFWCRRRDMKRAMRHWRIDFSPATK